MSTLPADDPCVLVLGGPTATGKSRLAAELACAVGGAVVNADSRQVYRGLEIGTAQPDARLRAMAPHFLVGFLSPAAEYSAGRYGADARRLITVLRGRGLPVVLCGGTGLYLRAALSGLFREGADQPGAGGRELPEAERVGARRLVRSTLASRWGAEGPEALHAELGRVDPALARGVHPRDRQRVLRGLEFHATTGRALSAARGPGPRSGPTTRRSGDRAWATAFSGSALEAPGALRIVLELDPVLTDRRIAERLDGMLQAGLLEEGRALLARYGKPPVAASSALGYLEILDHLRGELPLDEARRRIVVQTRQYAKRQRTWFRNQDAYRPVPAGDGAFSEVLAIWRERLP